MIRCALSGLGLALIAIVGTVLYYEGVSIPFAGAIIKGEIADRLEGYVSLSETIAAKVRAAELKRQADAARAATDEFRRRAQTAEAAEAAAQADLEKGIAAYEKRLVDTRRACLLDDDDIGQILQHR